MPVSLAFLVENVLTGLIVAGYLGYEIRWGRGQEYTDKMNGVVIILLAVVEEIDGVDDDRAKERLNGERPEDYRVQDVKADGGVRDGDD